MGIFLGDQLTNIISTARYIHDVPFLCFLCKLIRRRPFGTSHRSSPRQGAYERTIYRLNFTCESLEPILDLRDVEVAKADLQARIFKTRRGRNVQRKKSPHGASFSPPPTIGRGHRRVPRQRADRGHCVRLHPRPRRHSLHQARPGDVFLRRQRRP